MRFYTIKLPKFLGGIVRAMLNTFKKIKKAPITGAFSIVIVKKSLSALFLLLNTFDFARF